MRSNVLKVYNAWCSGRRCNMQSISTDGVTIYSYSTPMVYKTHDGYAFNMRKYSRTTTSQQNSLRVLMNRDGFPIVEFNND